ncbi:hypothetical protein EJB05_36913, partial [Eragrostis curvula]
MRHSSRAKEAAMPRGVDRISALPDGVLEHVLGFLPADRAVQTSVLARRWRHLWRSMRRLRLECNDKHKWHIADGFTKFMSGLLLLRNAAVALDEVEFRDSPIKDKDAACINIWVRHALSGQAKKLVIRFNTYYARLDGLPLVSQHLHRLEFGGVRLDRNVLDFGSCPVLQVLEIAGCQIFCERISSQSIKHLIVRCSSFSSGPRTRISIPTLVSLKLDFFKARAPLLETMPLLQMAYVEPCFFGIEDYCTKGGSRKSCGKCADCCGEDDHNGHSVLLGGLSSAGYLELKAYPAKIIFRRDLRWCPTFSNLKTLILNEWCVANEPSALICILQHSPVLEKMTLQLAKGPKDTMELGDIYNVMDKSADISKHLERVDVQCEVVDERVCNILKLLKTLDVKFTLERTKKYLQRCATWKACGPCLNCCSGHNDLNASDILGCLSNATKLELKITAWGTAFKWTEESEGISHPMDPLPSISELLHTVEIKCTEVDERVCFISKFLGGLFNHININLDDAP